MKHFCRLMTYLALLLPLTAAQAAKGATVTAKDVVATLEQGYAAITDLQADFSQRTAISAVNREEKGAGELFLKKSAGGAMFRFDYSKPRQQIVSNGKSVWYYLPENKQVIVSDAATLFGGGNAIALSYLTGLGRISTDFSASLAADARDKKGDYLLDLVPKKKSQVMSKLRLTVSARAVEEFLATGSASTPFPVVSSELYDLLGNKTRIDFSKVKVNRGLGSDRFNFKVPAGVEVIKP